jgi:hydrocephalus-inducing protein
VTVHPNPPVLRARATTELEVRHRPLLVGSSEGAVRLECAELGCYEWGLRLAGTAVNPERSLAFSAPLGGRDTQPLRFTHFLGDRAEYRCGFKSAAAAGAAGRQRGGGGGGGDVEGGNGSGGTGAGFDAPTTVVAPAATGPGEREASSHCAPAAAASPDVLRARVPLWATPPSQSSSPRTWLRARRRRRGGAGGGL